MEVRCGFTSDCLSADGDTLVCIGGDGDPNSVSVYSASAGEVVRCLSGHTDKVACVACEGDVIASSGRDKTIRLWSRESGACTAAFASGDEVVYGLALRRGLLLCGEARAAGASAALHAKARLWQLGERAISARPLSVFEEHTDSVRSVALTDVVAVTAGQDSTVRVWELSQAEERLRNEQGDGSTPRGAFSTTRGSTFDAVGARGVGVDTARADKSLCASLATFEHPSGFFLSSVHADGDVVATGCGDGRVRLWSLSKRE